MSELETVVTEFTYGEVTLFYMAGITVDGISGERGSSISRRMFDLLPTKENSRGPDNRTYFYIADFEVDEEEWLRCGNISNTNGTNYYELVEKKGMRRKW